MHLLKLLYKQQNTEQMDYEMENERYKVLFACHVVWCENKWGFLQDLEKAKLFKFFYQGDGACG